MNTDYAFASSIKKDIDNGMRRLLVTYDIGCQWGINLHHRLSSYLPPVNLDLGSLDSFRVAVPKFHLVGHGASCQVPFNLAFMDGVGLTHGEGVETIWAHSSSLATWSRENGPAARHQILDDHWGGWNWRKMISLRMFFAPAPRPILTPDQASTFARVSKKLGSGAKLSLRLQCRWMERSRRRQSSDGRRWLLNTRKTTRNRIHLMNPLLVSTLILSPIHLTMFEKLLLSMP